MRAFVLCPPRALGSAAMARAAPAAWPGSQRIVRDRSTRMGLFRSRRSIQSPEVIPECPEVQCPAVPRAPAMRSGTRSAGPCGAPHCSRCRCRAPDAAARRLHRHARPGPRLRHRRRPAPRIPAPAPSSPSAPPRSRSGWIRPSSPTSSPTGSRARSWRDSSAWTRPPESPRRCWPPSGRRATTAAPTRSSSGSKVTFQDGTAFDAAAVCSNFDRWFNFPDDAAAAGAGDDVQGRFQGPRRSGVALHLQGLHRRGPGQRHDRADPALHRVPAGPHPARLRHLLAPGPRVPKRRRAEPEPRRPARLRLRAPPGGNRPVRLQLLGPGQHHARQQQGLLGRQGPDRHHQLRHLRPHPDPDAGPARRQDRRLRRRHRRQLRPARQARPADHPARSRSPSCTWA